MAFTSFKMCAKEFVTSTCFGTVEVNDVQYVCTPLGYFRIKEMYDGSCLMDDKAWYSSLSCIKKGNFDAQGNCKCFHCLPENRPEL